MSAISITDQYPGLKYAKPPPYKTKLSDTDEAGFQKWVKENKIPFEDSVRSDYDMRGYYQALMSGDPRAKQSEDTKHFPDIWKTPFHKTFSNESIYSTSEAPHWEGDVLIDKDGNIIADERKK